MKNKIYVLISTMIIVSIILVACTAGGSENTEEVVNTSGEPTIAEEVSSNLETESSTNETKESPTTEKATEKATEEATEKPTETTINPSATQNQTTTQAPSMSNAEMCKRVWELVNEERAKAGLKPLEYRSDVQAAANQRAKELAQSFSHTRPDGRDCLTVFEDLGFSISCWCSENAATEGYSSTPESVMKGWMNSSGHKANIMSKNAQGIVVGVYQSNGRTYWVQLFNNITLSDEKEFGL